MKAKKIYLLSEVEEIWNDYMSNGSDKLFKDSKFWTLHHDRLLGTITQAQFAQGFKEYLESKDI